MKTKLGRLQLNIAKTPLRMLVVVSALAVFAGSRVYAASPSDDSLPAVQENVAAHRAVIVDVREPGEWKNGHLAGAISLPLSSLIRGVDPAALEQQLPKDKIIYTHCVMGVRALAAGKILEKQGYNVHPLKANYEDLVKAGPPKATE